MALGVVVVKTNNRRSLDNLGGYKTYHSLQVIHIAAHVSWKLSSIVLSPSEYVKSDQWDEESGTESGSGFDTPSLTEYLLTAADILNTKLNCKLVVLSSGHTGKSQR